MGDLPYFLPAKAAAHVAEPPHCSSGFAELRDLGQIQLHDPDISRPS